MGLVTYYIYLAALSTWLWIAILLVTLYWLYMHQISNKFYESSIARTDNKIFIVTGAESGVGKSTAYLLATRGGRIIMACKDLTLGEAAKDEIVKRTKNYLLEVRYLDLESLESVRKFSAEIHKSVNKLDALVNNPPLSCTSSTKTADGLNTIMQVNHFGPFLLTNLLLDLLKKSTSSRLVFVSSIYHHFHKFSLDNINCDKETLPCCRIYFNSKLANILTAKYFARILQGTGVTVNSVNPGITKPDPTSASCSGSFIGRIYNLWREIFAKTFHEAAMTTTYAVCDPALRYITGQHFSECRISRCVAKIANDHIIQELLYEKSSELVHLRLEESHV